MPYTRLTPAATSTSTNCSATVIDIAILHSIKIDCLPARARLDVSSQLKIRRAMLRIRPGTVQDQLVMLSCLFSYRVGPRAHQACLRAARAFLGMHANGA